MIGGACQFLEPFLGKNSWTVFFMCCWALPCDLDHCFKCYGMANSNSNTPCGLCPVDASAMPWFDFRVNADWIQHIYTVQSWIAAGMKRSIVMDIIGVSVLSFYPDWMHCKSLGIDKQLIGAAWKHGAFLRNVFRVLSLVYCFVGLLLYG